MYYDQVSFSMQEAIDETNRRRNIQIGYNKRIILSQGLLLKSAKYFGKRIKSETINDDIKRIVSDEKLSKKILSINLSLSLMRQLVMKGLKMLSF